MKLYSVFFFKTVLLSIVKYNIYSTYYILSMRKSVSELISVSKYLYYNLLSLGLD